jgi:flagellar protein FlgJ
MRIANASSSVAAAAGAKPAADPGLAKAARAFEAIFMRQMIGAMRSASLDDGLLDSGATEQFRDMADARTADSMAETGNFGIAQLLMRQFANRVSAAPAPASPTGTAPEA